MEEISFIGIMQRFLNMMKNKVLKYVNALFQKWLKVTLQARKLEMEKNSTQQIDKVVEIMTISVRGKRSPIEKEFLGKFLRGITCLPKLSSQELETLSNEIDWVACQGSSLLFLQGDYGPVFYMIAHGTVELYLESSKEKEMSNCRQYGAYRGKFIEMSVCSNFGRHVATLRKGQGFGELAILSTTHKFRGATAVASDDKSLMFVVHTETYNAIFRKHHFRQNNMSRAMTLLRELPMFRWASVPKVAQIAYGMTSQNFSSRSVVVRSGQPIAYLILIISGLVRVTDSSINKLGFALREMGRGQIIGQSEIFKGQLHFEMTYETSSPTDVFQLPLAIFQEMVASSKFVVLDDPEPQNNKAGDGSKVGVTAYEGISSLENKMKALHSSRLERVHQSLIESGLQTRQNDVDTKTQLRSMAPLLERDSHREYGTAPAGPQNTFAGAAGGGAGTGSRLNGSGADKGALPLSNSLSQASTRPYQPATSMGASAVVVPRKGCYESPPVMKPKQALTVPTMMHAVGLFDASLLAAKISPHKPQAPSEGRSSDGNKTPNKRGHRLTH